MWGEARVRLRFTVLILLVFSLLLPVAYGENTSAHHGCLYRVRHQGNTVWLFGTIHVGTASVDPLEGEAASALEEADRLVLEINVEDGAAIQKAFLKHAMYRPGDGIGEHLSKVALDRLRKATAHAGIAFEAVSGMKPWLVVEVLTQKMLERKGYAAQNAVEFQLARYADDDEKPIGELESAEFQVGIFDRMTGAQQEAYLSESLDELESGKAEKEIDEIFDAWTRADEAALKPLLKEMNDNKGPAMRFVQSELFEKRNPPMAGKIAGMLQTEKDVFVGVGWLHLVGKDGVPELLKRRGFEVTRIY